MATKESEYDFDCIDWEVDCLDNYLDQVTKRDGQGMYLIHHAVRNSAPFSFVQKILTVLPDCLVLKDKNMRLPLHHAAQSGASDEILEHLVAQYSKGLRERDQVGMLPMHYLVGNSTSLKLLQLFERHYPDSIKEKDREGWLPLHHAARRNSSVEILNFLVQKYPGGLSDSTYHGSLPIHCAAYYNPNLPVIQFLSEQFPRGLKEGGTNGMRPIHSAARNNRWEILQYFVNQYPLGLHCLDHQERLPVHYAIKNPDPLPIVSHLINLFPEFVRKVDSNGWLPLHCAARSSDSIELIQYLIKLYPEALKIPDNQQWLPIFHAAKFNQSFEIIRYIYEQYPEGILVKLSEDIYCHELAAIASNQRNFLGLQFMALDTSDVAVYNEVVRIHLCGDRQSGKTTICSQMKEILLESFNIGGLFDKSLESSNFLKSANLGTSANSIINNTTNNTTNIQAPNSYATPSIKVKSPNDTYRIIAKNSFDKYSHYLLFDYGGQVGYHVNHGNFLALPNSLYVITIPIYDKVNKQKFNLDYLLDRFFYWLRFLFSTAHSMTNNSSSTLSSGKTKPVIPIAVVINNFAVDSKVSNDEVNGIKHVLYHEAMTTFNIKSQQEYLQYYEMDPLYANDHTDFVLMGNEPLILDLSIKQSIRKLTEALKRGAPLLHLSQRASIISPFNIAYLPDSSAPFFGNRTHQAKDINPFFNVVKESKLISYCWDVLALLDLSLVMLEEDFRLMLTSTIRTFFHKMLNYKDYKIKESLQSLIERELYQYMLNYFVFMGKIMVIKRKKSVLPPLKLTNATPAPLKLQLETLISDLTSSLHDKDIITTVSLPENDESNPPADLPPAPPISTSSDVGKAPKDESEANTRGLEFEVDHNPVTSEGDEESSGSKEKENEISKSEEDEEEEELPIHPPPAPPSAINFDPYKSEDAQEEDEDDDDDDSSSSSNERSDIDQSDDGAKRTSEDYHPLHVNSTEYEYEYIVITSPHLLINTVLDFLIDKLIVEIRQNKKQLLLSPGELEAWFRDQQGATTASSSISILDLLVTLRVALPVYYNESANTQMIRLIHQDDMIAVDSLATNSSFATHRPHSTASLSNPSTVVTTPLTHLHQYYWLFQLSNDKIPESLNINYEFIATITNFNHFHGTSLIPTIYREISRVFTFRNQKFFFFPAWFTHLYTFLLSKIPNVLHFNIYSDGLLIISKEIGLIIQPCSYHPPPPSALSTEDTANSPSTSHSTSSSSWSAAHHGSLCNGFVVKVVTSLMMNIENRNHYTNDFLWNLVNEIRYFVASKFWNYEVQEFAIHPSTEAIATFLSQLSGISSSSLTKATSSALPVSYLLYPIEELEKIWFTSHQMGSVEFETYFGIHHPPYHHLYPQYAQQCFDHKLIYLMKSHSSTTSSYHKMARVTNQYSKDKFSEKEEHLISRILLASKYSLLFDPRVLCGIDDVESEVLTIDNMNEATKESIIQVIMDYKRPQQMNNTHAISSHYFLASSPSFTPHFHSLHSNQSNYYTILTKTEILSILEKSINAFHLLRSENSNQFLKKIQDFPLIPILSYCPASEEEGDCTASMLAVASSAGNEEIVIAEDVRRLSSRSFLASESVKTVKSSADSTGSKIKTATTSSVSNIHSFRVHFLCPVCGRRVHSGKDYRGYLITVLNQWSEHLLEVFVMTMKIFIYLTNIKPIASNNQTIPELAYLLQDTIEVLLSQIDPQFNSKLERNRGGSVSSAVPPSLVSSLSIPPVILYQLQKKIFYVMKNYSLKSYQQIRKLKDSINKVSKISLPKISLSDPYSSALVPPINTNNIPTPTNPANGNDLWKSLSLFGMSGGNASGTTTSSSVAGSAALPLNSATAANISNNAKLSGPNLGSNVNHILSEEDIHAIASTTSFSSVIQEIFKFTGSKEVTPSIVSEDLEKYLAMIPINHDAYMNLLREFFKVVDDEYLLHTGLMRVENSRGEIAWVCPPERIAQSVLQTAAASLSSPEPPVNPTLADYNWNYSYKKDNPQFKSSCADEFLDRGKRCLINQYHEY